MSAYPLQVMNADAFKTLQDEYHSITNALSRKISSLTTSSDQGERKALIQEAEADIYDAQNVLKKMEIEIRPYPYHLKGECQQQLKLLQTSFDSQKRDLERLRQGSGSRRGKGDRDDTRARLLEGKSLVDESEESLLNTQRTLASTAETGQATMNTLVIQREQIIRTRDAVHDTDDIVSRARRTIQRIARRTVTNKLITGFVILLELAGVGVVVWWKFFKN